MIITDLYGQFEKSRRAAYAITTNTPAKQAKFDRAAAGLGRMAARIAKTPANTVDEMLLKIDAVLAEGEDAQRQCLVSLRDDLRLLRRLEAH